MKFVIQRVGHASVTVDGENIAGIGRGFLVLIGISPEDDRETADQMIRKLIGMRIFEDGSGKTNLALADVDGQLLLVSQFTLYADCRKGNRPSFSGAADPQTAEALYDYIVTQCQLRIPHVAKGIFGADMKIELLNDGPFTIVLDSEDLG